MLAPFSPSQQFRDAFLSPPAWVAGSDPRFLLGTDDVGRDILSRLIYGARLSLMIGVVVVTLALAVGVTLGLVAGYFGGIADVAIMRLMDIMLALPALLLAIVIVAILGPGPDQRDDCGDGRRDPALCASDTRRRFDRAGP